MNKKLRLIGPVLILAIIAGGWVAFGKEQSTPSAQVMTMPVSRGTIEQTVLATGTLKPARMVAVGAQVSGRITSVEVALGQDVKAGDLIAQIDSVTQLNQLRTAEAALAGVQAQRSEREANLANAQRGLARQKGMLDKRAAAQVDYDNAAESVAVLQAQIKALDAQIVQSELAIETARANVGYTRITAPIDGTVLAIISQEGQTVNAMQSAPTIVILGQLDHMTVRAEISEADIVHIKPGQNVWFNILGDTRKRYESRLESVEPAPEEIRNDSAINSASTSSGSANTAIYYNGVFTVPNPQRFLRTYMTAQVYIVLGRAQDVLTIPASALGAKGQGDSYAVRVQQADGAIVTRDVAVGLNDKLMVEVKSGLSEGDRVVTGDASAAAASAGARRMGRPGPPMGF